MADRGAGATQGGWGGLIDGLLRRFSDLERRTAALEARSGQTLPGDFRFETNDDGQLVIRRVSTGATYVIDV